MVHDLNPFLWRISGEFGIRWYGLSYMLGFVCAYFLIIWLSRRQHSGFTVNMVGDFVTYAAIGTLIGGRLGYCIFYSPDLFLKFKSAFPFWGVLAVNEGGMASHGGMIGLVAACILYARKYGVSQLYLFDLIAVTGPVGIFFGRIANFINGELVGRPCDPSNPIAVKFPQDILMWPFEQVNKLSELLSVVDKIGISKDQWLTLMDKFKYDAQARDTVNDILNQIIRSIQGGNTAAKEAIAPLLTPRYPSQLFGAAGEGLFIFLVLFLMWRKPRKPGVIGAMFVVLYAIVRISDEQFRMPDAQIGYQLFGLTRGQWLSIAMLAVGLVLLFIWSQRASLPIYGWGRSKNVKISRR